MRQRDNLAVFKGYVAWPVEPQSRVHEAGEFHTFDDFTAAWPDRITYGRCRRIAAQNDRSSVLSRVLSQLLALA